MYVRSKINTWFIFFIYQFSVKWVHFFAFSKGINRIFVWEYQSELVDLNVYIICSIPLQLFLLYSKRIDKWKHLQVSFWVPFDLTQKSLILTFWYDKMFQDHLLISCFNCRISHFSKDTWKKYFVMLASYAYAIIYLTSSLLRRKRLQIVSNYSLLWIKYLAML